MRFEGTLKSWNEERGFGFIQPDQGGDEVFVHIKAIVNREGRPQPGQRLSFEVELGPQGKKRAKSVLPVRAVASIKPRSGPKQSAAQWGGATLFAIPAFLVLYLVVTLLWRPSGYVALLYVAASLLTFVAYAADKAAAVRSAQRTPENVLHLLSLVGGWPGALIAQQVLRHKSSKAEFRALFWVTVVVNITAFALLCSPLMRTHLARV